MRPDKDVYFSTFEIHQCLALLLRRTESIDVIHRYRKSFQSFREGFEVLEGENSGWHKHCDLFAICRSFECCAYSNFRFSKANITTNKTVHRHGAFHIFFHRFRSWNLIRRVFVQKAGLQFMLEVAVWRAFESNSLLAFCVQLDQIKSNLLHLRLRLLLERLPLWTTQFIQLRRSAVFSIELTDLMQRMNADIQNVVVSIDQFYGLLYGTVIVNFLQTSEFSDTVVYMRYIITKLQSI